MINILLVEIVTNSNIFPLLLCHEVNGNYKYYFPASPTITFLIHLLILFYCFYIYSLVYTLFGPPPQRSDPCFLAEHFLPSYFLILLNRKYKRQEERQHFC
jgi:hypothetical protein